MASGKEKEGNLPNEQRADPAGPIAADVARRRMVESGVWWSLRPSTRNIFEAIITTSRPDGSCPGATMERIAMIAEAGVRSARRAADELRRCGAISVIRNGRLPAIIRIVGDIPSHHAVGHIKRFPSQSGRILGTSNGEFAKKRGFSKNRSKNGRFECDSSEIHRSLGTSNGESGEKRGFSNNSHEQRSEFGHIKCDSSEIHRSLGTSNGEFAQKQGYLNFQPKNVDDHQPVNSAENPEVGHIKCDSEQPRHLIRPISALKHVDIKAPKNGKPHNGNGMRQNQQESVGSEQENGGMVLRIKYIPPLTPPFSYRSGKINAKKSKTSSNSDAGLFGSGDDTSPKNGAVHPTDLELYQAYPRHDGCAEALPKIAKAVEGLMRRPEFKHLDEATVRRWLMAKVTVYAAQRRQEIAAGESERKWTPYPARWFFRCRFDDEQLSQPAVPTLAQPEPTDADGEADF